MNLLKKNPILNKGKDILSLLLNSRDQEIEAKKLTDKDIIADIFIFLVAGHETTAHTLLFSLHLLATHPEVQEELHQCVVAAIGKADPTYDDLPKLNFAYNIFKETLRLFPSVPMIPKVAIEATTLNGHTIPPKTRVNIHIFKIQRDPQYWKDPNKFDPHRWDENSGQIGPTNPHCFFVVFFRKKELHWKKICRS